MPENKDEAPKILIDSDWKEEARREKEELDRQTRETASGAGGVPEPSVLELVQMVVMQASIGLGGFQDPDTGQRVPPNLALAKHYIDLLQLLDEKLGDRIDPEEKNIIEGTLHQLRLAFVQVAGAGAGGDKQAAPSDNAGK